MKSGLIRSCGCFDLESKRSSTTKAIKHGKCGTKTYRIWKGIHVRTTNKNTWNYCNYGGRGIEVCSEWGDFNVFLKDMGECPEGRSIDRIDNNKGYCKENCKWSTMSEQARNTRRTHFIDVFGKKMCVTALSEMSGLSHGTITKRLAKGWLIEDIILTPGRNK
jgi:hypothetical protein